ncbi:MAG: sterol desaturase family protein [Acidimicrobiia bacterium]|nr:sterol desaturase family protein [Acidimicrobiia bacterium]
MAVEHWWLRRRRERRGPTPADYEPRDTRASLLMGVGSLVVPLVADRIARRVAPGFGRWGKPLLAATAAAAVVTTIADRVGAGPDEQIRPDSGVAIRTRSDRRRARRLARKIASAGGVATIAAGTTAATSALAMASTPDRMFGRRLLPDLGGGPWALALAVLGWDLIYYWNHRFMHESRFMWAIHVVHHSSEHYNLSTALRQPVADMFGLFVPSTLLCLLGVRPELVATARGVNLLYQFWIHTDAIRRIGPLETVLNTPSHHRVHHGSNKRYIDRNHGSILIIWDRLFGTFAAEDPDEPVVYGLTKNIDTFNPARIATHEYADMLREVAGSTTWSDRLGFVLRSPGWAYARRAEMAAGDEAAATLRANNPYREQAQDANLANQ